MTRWRRTDTRTLITALAGWALVTVPVASWSLPTAAVLGAGLALAITAGLVLAAQRRLVSALEAERAEQQALAELVALLGLRRPLPPMTGWAATPRLCHTLVELIWRARPRRIVELGSGVSTLVAGYALERLGAGRLTSYDHDPRFAAQTRARLADHGLNDWVEVVDAPLEPVTIGDRLVRWYRIEADQAPAPIDLLVIDGPPEQSAPQARAPALAWCADRMAPRAWIVLDDAGRPAERAAIEAFIAAHPEWTVEWHPTPKGLAVLERAPAP